MALYEEIDAAYEEIADHYREVAGDGELEFSEVLTLFWQAATTIGRLVESFGDLSPEERRAQIVEAITRLYDEVIAPIDIKPVPDMIEGYIDQMLRDVIVGQVEHYADVLADLFERIAPSEGSPTILLLGSKKGDK